MPKSAYLANAIINHVLRGQEYVRPDRLFVGLFTTSPDVDGGNGVEVQAQEYIRILVTMNPPQGRTSTNANKVTFPTSLTVWGQVVASGIFDAQIGGNLLYFGPFGTQKIVTANDRMEFEIGQLVLVEN